MARRFRLRRFLYLDEDLTQRFLAQAEGGLYDEEAQTETATTGKKRGAGVKLGPASAEAARDTDQETTTSRTVRQTSDAAFARLAALLEGDDAVQYLDAFDEDIWRDLRRGEVIEIECRISVPLLVQLGLLVKTTPVADIVSAFGAELPPDAETVFEQIRVMTGMLKSVPVVGEALGSPEFKFIAPISPDFLRAGLDELSGDATMFATLDRKLRHDESWSLLDAMGLGMLPPESRAEVERGLSETEELQDSVVSGPAGLVSPIAIYR